MVRDEKYWNEINARYERNVEARVDAEPLVANNDEIIVQEIPEKEEAPTKFTTVLVLNNCSEEEVDTFLAQINSQTYKPTEISVVLCGKDYPKHTWLRQKLNETGLRWHIHNLPSKNLLESIDIAVKNCSSLYYTIFNVGDKLAPTFYEKFDNILRKEKQRFFALEPVNQGTLSYASVMSFCHNRFGGNKLAETTEDYGPVQRVDFIVDKLKFICKDHGQEYHIKTNQEVGLL